MTTNVLNIFILKYEKPINNDQNPMLKFGNKIETLSLS